MHAPSTLSWRIIVRNSRRRTLKNMCSVQAFLAPNDPNNEGHVAFELDGQEDNEEDEEMEDDGDDGDAGGI